MKKIIKTINVKYFFVSFIIIITAAIGVFNCSKNNKLFKELFKTLPLEMPFTHNQLKNCIDLLEKLTDQAFQAGQLFLFDGAPTIGQCHLIAQKIACLYNSYQAHNFYKTSKNKAFLALTFLTSNSFARPNRLSNLCKFFPEISNNTTFLNFFNSEKLQKQASECIEKFLVEDLQDDIKHFDDPLANEINTLLKTTSSVPPKFVTVEIFLRTLQTQVNSPSLLVKTKIMCTNGHHIALLKPSQPDNYFNLLNASQYTHQSAIIFEGFSLPDTITPEVYEKIQKECPHAYKITQEQKTHDLDKKCLACTLCPNANKCATYKKVIDELKTHTSQSLIMPIAADFVAMHEPLQKKLIMESSNYPHLKKLFIELSKIGKEKGLTDKEPCTFTIRHVYPCIMTEIDQKKRYIDTRINSLLKTIKN